MLEKLNSNFKDLALLNGLSLLDFVFIYLVPRISDAFSITNDDFLFLTYDPKVV